MTELALNHDQRDAFVGHLDRVRVTELVGREPATDTGRRRGSLQLFAGGGRLPASAGRRAVDHAQQRADGQLSA